MEPLASIIIPFYGKADPALLDRCLASLRRQEAEEGKDYEIIVADTPLRSTGDARNRGIGRARGQYLFFVDADDLLLPGSLRPVLDVARSEQPDIVRFGFRTFGGQPPTDVSPTGPDRLTRYPNGAAFMAAHNFTGVIWTQFYRREFILSHGLRFSNTSHFDDEEFAAKAYACAGPMVETRRTVYACYENPASITRDIPPEKRRQRLDAFRQLLERLLDFRDSLPDADARHALDRRLCFLTIDYVRQMRRNRCTPGQMRQRLHELCPTGLLPLPARPYGWKYALARMGVNLLAT